MQTMTPPDSPTLRVYYNSACPVCDAGVKSQKSKHALCGIDWKDVHLDEQLAKELNQDLEFIRERLHVIDEQGDIQVGLEAFIVLWRYSAHEQWKARLASLPVLKPTLSMAYNTFARWLYRWNRRRNHW